MDSQGSVLGVWVSPADVSDARGARVVLEQVLRRYPSVQMVVADGAYDKEGLLEWLLEAFCVALDCVWREGKGFVVLERRWLVERSFAWLLGCRRLSRCYDGLCEVEACWIEWACVRWFVRIRACPDHAGADCATPETAGRTRSARSAQRRSLPAAQQVAPLG